MSIIKGPDFPGGGIIINNKDLKKAFTTGRGRITLRGKVEIKEDKKKNKYIEIVEIPYQVKPCDLIKKILDLKADGKIEGIKDVDDMSDKNLSIVISLKKDANIELILNQLYKLTDLQKNINYNMNALLNGKPVTVTLGEYMNEYLSHCLEVLVRKTKFELAKDSKRLDIIEAIFAASENFDDVVEIQKTSDNPITELMEKFNFSNEQAKYIDDAKLRRLVRQEELKKLENEYTELKEIIAEHNRIIEDELYALDVLYKELDELEEKFGDERRTSIELTGNGDITDEDLIKDEPLVVTITSDGLIKSVDEKEYSTQKRGGKGTKAASTKNDEIVTDLFSINSKDDILFISNTGKCHKVKGYAIPKVSKTGKGKHINNFIKLDENEEIVSVMALNIKKEAESSILFVTALGQVKRLSVKDLGSRYSAIRVLTIKEGDALQTCLKVDEGQDVILCTAKGQSIRFTVSTETKKPAGVLGIKVAEDDYVVGATAIEDGSNILTLTANGLAKQTKGAAWEAKGRGGKGIVCHKITERTGDLVCVLAVKENEEIFVGTESGKIIRLSVNDISTSGRAAIGTKVISLTDNDCAFTASLAPITLDNEEEETIEE